MRIGGVVYLRINGKLVTLGDGEVTMNVGGLKREGVLSGSGFAGHSAKPVIPFCEGELLYVKDLDVSSLADTEEADVTIELYNDKTFLLQEAYWAGEGVEVTSEGKMKFRFEGKQAELIDS